MGLLINLIFWVCLLIAAPWWLSLAVVLVLVTGAVEW